MSNVNFENKPILKKMYTASIWISRLAIINLLWLAFSILGLIVFGIGPATIAMTVVINRWIVGEEDLRPFPLFFSIYKKYFIKANIISLIVMIIGFITGFNVYFTLIHNLPIYTKSLAGGAAIVFFLIAVVIFPLYSNNETPFSQLFKTCLFFIVGYPINSLIILAATIGLITIQLFMPGLMFFFSGSAVTFFSILRIHKAIEKTRKIQQI